LQEVLGDRQAVVTRELTKLFEEARRDSLSALVTYYQTHGEPKGEVVLLVDRAQDVQASREDIESQLSVLLSSHSVKEAAAIVAEQTGRPRKEIYSLALALKQRDG
jgi:16S rRNA (cytidine1402-2'-O)-methyltransferase